MVYYLNENFRSEDKFSINGLEIIQTLGCNVTNSKSEDIIYLLGKKTKENGVYKDIRINIMKSGIGEVETVSDFIKDGYLPKIKVVAFNSNVENTIIYSSQCDNKRNEKYLMCYTYSKNKFDLSFDSESFKVNNKLTVEDDKDKSSRAISKLGNEEYLYYNSGIDGKKHKNSKKRKDGISESKEIIDFRLAYDFDIEDYTLIIYQNVTNKAVLESELKLNSGEFRVKTKNIIIK